MSDDEDNDTTKPFLTQVVPSPLITKENLALAHPDYSEGTDDRGFWNAESRPVEWGQDSDIATAVKYSVRHHPQKCDKCTKLGVACLVLPDKKFRCIRLACTNCNDMKITCAINGVGVWERMQAKAKAKAAEDTCNPVRRSKSCAPKSRVVNNAPVNTRSRKTVMPPALSSSEVEPNIIECADSAPDANPLCVDVSPVHTEVQLMPTMCPSVHAEAEVPQAVNPAEPEPTARDILQSIQDLGRWLDLLATNERVDELDARLGPVEDIFGQRLSALEQCLNSSDTEWRAMSASVGHLTIALHDHKDDLTAHRSRINTTAYAPPTHVNAHLPAWLAQSDEDPHISVLTVTTDKVVPPGDEQGFWDAETRPTEWGSDAHIATPCQHSIHYHPWQCDKCTKLDIPCVVLPDKKFGYTRLACTNCDQMKITCAIDGIGVRQRMQEKAAAAASRHSGTLIKKSREISKTPVKRTLAQPPRVELNIVEEEKQQPGPPPGVPMHTVPTVGTSLRPEQDDQTAPANIADPEPTARDILQGIRDLSKRLDLFATNERVDTMEIRVHSVENILHQRLNALEQHLNASDAR
ncbi:uncharacterized protein HD556DRAFT_1436351 [Suillus plorans]|uniref:Uncharacterized protein n=1 Tax=Suillus plorans TaxID=116603 RepID=A0A9P7DYB1_9AGAM|nr:uncharacterized protein HD556DRAFT_1436351 [Suillus plorans]KAG1806386.1 hypothetical protein HD556DRAFT_1436351 [Suillus plorans]